MKCGRKECTFLVNGGYFMLLKQFSCSLLLFLGMSTTAIGDAPRAETELSPKIMIDESGDYPKVIEEAPADLDFPTSPAEPKGASVLNERRACKYASECRWDWARECEWWCQNVGGFDIMKSCSWGKSRCCCNG